MVTQKGHTVRERSAAVIQEQLRKVGLTMDVVPMDVGALIGRYKEAEYDAMYFSFTYDSFDPARYMDFWTTSGGFHVWNPGQTKPATSWEGADRRA